MVLAMLSQGAFLARGFANPSIAGPSASTSPIANFDSPGRADFNRDGLPDQGVLLYGRGATTIYLSLSGERRPQRIRVEERLIGVVASDIDRDGDPDLLAFTRNLRVLVWVNNSRGRFTPRKSALRHGHRGTFLEKQISRLTTLFLWSNSHDDETKLLLAAASSNETGPARISVRQPPFGIQPFEATCIAGCPPRGPPSQLLPV